MHYKKWLQPGVITLNYIPADCESLNGLNGIINQLNRFFGNGKDEFSQLLFAVAVVVVIFGKMMTT